MDDLLQKAFVNGVERVSAWADLLDSINVFPIADGDTGRNLSISLTPLRAGNEGKEVVIRRLLLAARGNSGNIASRFFSSFYTAQSLSELSFCAAAGREKAWQAVNDPRPDTMLLSKLCRRQEILSAGTIYIPPLSAVWKNPFTIPAIYCRS
jgi:uncharacterized protein